jgi:hypothetical protein
MAILREVGIVTQSRSRLYQIKPQFLADRDQRIVDLNASPLPPIGRTRPWRVRTVNAGFGMGYCLWLKEVLVAN